MARSQVTVVGSQQGGVDLVTDPADAVNGHEFDNDLGKTVLLVLNGLGGASTGAVQVEVYSAASPYGRGGGGAGDPSNITYSVGQNEAASIGPFPPLLFNQAGDAVSNGVLFDIDAAPSNCVFAALRVASATP